MLSSQNKEYGKVIQPMMAGHVHPYGMLLIALDLVSSILW
jgi:hypothetical protein